MSSGSSLSREDMERFIAEMVKKEQIKERKNDPRLRPSDKSPAGRIVGDVIDKLKRGEY